jgi:hypothetical protein
MLARAVADMQDRAELLGSRQGADGARQRADGDDLPAPGDLVGPPCALPRTPVRLIIPELECPTGGSGFTGSWQLGPMDQWFACVICAGMRDSSAG